MKKTGAINASSFFDTTSSSDLRLMSDTVVFSVGWGLIIG
jgi:hypothetical protein